VKVNNLYYVNVLMVGEAVSNMVSLDLIKKLEIKVLLKDPGKYTTANGQKSQALGIAQCIIIYFMEKLLRFSSSVYNHSAFLLSSERKVLHKLKALIGWNLGKWYIKTSKRSNVEIPINFDTNYGIRKIVTSDSIAEDETEIEK